MLCASARMRSCQDRSTSDCQVRRLTMKCFRCRCREIAAELLEELLAETTASVDSLVAMEWSGAFAVARREFSKTSAQHLEGLKTLLASGGSLAPSNDVRSAAAGKAGQLVTQSSGRSRFTAEQQGGAAGHGGFVTVGGVGPAAASGLYETGAALGSLPATSTGPAELLSMMAAVLTYYGISCRRLADTVSLAVMHHLVNSFINKLRPRLAAELLALSPTAVGSLLVEDSQSAAKRAALTNQKEVLEQAMKVIRAAV